jgi:RNA polymerase sigma-70 factor, ECF subfamily
VDAVVSGQAGVALLLDGKKLSSIHFGGAGEVLPRNLSEVHLLLGGAGDLQVLKNVKLAQVRERLDLESTRADALHLALILLDADLSDETRRTAAEELEEELADDGIASWLEGVLYAHPLPASADLAGARSVFPEEAGRVVSLFGSLEELQGAITEVYRAWEGIPERLFGSSDNRSVVRASFVIGGVFREIVSLYSSGGSFDSFALASEGTASISVQGSSEILNRWVADLRKPLQAHPSPKALTERDIPEPLSEATEDLFRRYFRPVVAFFLHKGFSTEESHDLAEETFLRAYKNREGVRRDINLSAWLFQIANNLYKNALRRQAVLKREFQEVPIESTDARAPESKDGTLELMLTKERSRLLLEALEELPPQMKRAVMLRMNSDLTYREIAEEMEVSIETVKRHLYQARQHLRGKLAKDYWDG